MIQFKRLTIALLALVSISATAWAQETVETTLWEGTYTDGVEINSTTVSEFNAGDVLRVYVTIPDGGANFKIVYKGESNSWTETTIPSVDNQWPWINDGDTYMDVTFTEADITALTGMGIYIYKGEQSTITKVTLITPAPEPAAGEVTINDDKDEASFTMPQNDVTVNYTLKRDMTVDMAVTVQDAQQNSRFRVQKQGNNFVPVGLNMQQVLALFNVHDDIENTDLTLQQDYYGLIFSLDDDDQPTGDGVLLANFNFAPGRYAVRAIGQEGSNYVGTTEQSNVFTLYQGYPVDVAAQSFATYYSDDEALTLEDSFAETAGLYTVASVTATEAVLSEKIDVMPKRTPMLIYNESETAQQILLIPTADVAPLANVADEFKGTAVEKELTAEEVAATNFYVLTDQNQFVWVKDAGTIAAHRCWLEIAPSEAAGARRIVFSGSGTTGIDAATLRDITTGDWYDLNGRKINMPTKKGVYIFNGKKVVIK